MFRVVAITGSKFIQWSQVIQQTAFRNLLNNNAPIYTVIALTCWDPQFSKGSTVWYPCDAWKLAKSALVRSGIKFLWWRQNRERVDPSHQPKWPELQWTVQLCIICSCLNSCSILRQFAQTWSWHDLLLSRLSQVCPKFEFWKPRFGHFDRRFISGEETRTCLNVVASKQKEQWPGLVFVQVLQLVVQTFITAVPEAARSRQIWKLRKCHPEKYFCCWSSLSHGKDMLVFVYLNFCHVSLAKNPPALMFVRRLRGQRLVMGCEWFAWCKMGHLLWPSNQWWSWQVENENTPKICWSRLSRTLVPSLFLELRAVWGRQTQRAWVPTKYAYEGPKTRVRIWLASPAPRVWWPQPTSNHPKKNYVWKIIFWSLVYRTQNLEDFCGLFSWWGTLLE